jgi:hypothetical protein
MLHRKLLDFFFRELTHAWLVPSTKFVKCGRFFAAIVFFAHREGMGDAGIGRESCRIWRLRYP